MALTVWSSARYTFPLPPDHRFPVAKYGLLRDRVIEDLRTRVRIALNDESYREVLLCPGLLDQRSGRSSQIDGFVQPIGRRAFEHFELPQLHYRSQPFLR